MTRRVLVVGAGIAGLATARALRDVDIDVEVVERRTGAPSPGLGLNLPGNAVRALNALGLAEQVLAAGVPVARREDRTARDRLLFAVDEAAFWSGVAQSVCLRPGLLLEALGTDKKYAAALVPCVSTRVRTVHTSSSTTAPRRTTTSWWVRTACTPPSEKRW